MNSVTESAEFGVTFRCGEEQLFGVIHAGTDTTHTGVIIVVGGPQYRIGAHRQFLLLARAIAAAGFPVLRFDYRGMGDSSGEVRTFETIDDDIRAAVDLFLERTRTIRNVVLWGLCDGASAAVMYAAGDSRVRGLVLVNPWVHTEGGEARARLRHYYWTRLTSKDFWRKALRFDIKLGNTLGSLIGYVCRAFRFRSATQVGTDHYLQRMLDGARRFTGSIEVILSENDLIASEYRDLLATNGAWREVMTRAGVKTIDLAGSNHTFSTREARAQVARHTLARLDEWSGRWS